jgi:hypothetical protein
MDMADARVRRPGQRGGARMQAIVIKIPNTA